MTAATATKPVQKPAEKPAAEKPAAPAFDFATVTAVPVETVGNEYRRLDKLPIFRTWVAESLSTGKGVSIPIPADQVKTAKSLLRLASKEKGKGIRFAETPAASGQVTLAFRVGNKRADKGPRKPVKRNVETDAQFQTRVKTWETETGRKYRD